MNNPKTKLTPQIVESAIESVTYTRLPSGTAIVCEITLRGLHRVHGIAGVIDLDNYDEDLGKKAAYTKAFNAAFEVLSVVVHENIANGKIESRHHELCAAHIKQPQLLD